jgi:hypothetical protein
VPPPLTPVPMTVHEAIERKNELGRAFGVAVYRKDWWWNVNDRSVRHSDGTVVSIDCNSDVWVSKPRETAAEANAPLP